MTLRPHSLPRFTLLPAAAALLLAGCGGGVAVQVGDYPVQAADLDAAVEELSQAFSAYGTDTLRWTLLDQGMGAAAILHGRHPEASTAARAEAERWEARVRAGEDFRELVLEHQPPPISTVPEDPPANPNPSHLGARVAARVATMEDGDWAGPLRTQGGWEIIQLVRRFDPNRSRANVQMLRLVFPVADEAATTRARLDWQVLPLTGDPEYLRAVPPEIRRSRVRPQ